MELSYGTNHAVVRLQHCKLCYRSPSYCPYCSQKFALIFQLFNKFYFIYCYLQSAMNSIYVIRPFSEYFNIINGIYISKYNRLFKRYGQIIFVDTCWAFATFCSNFRAFIIFENGARFIIYIRDSNLYYMSCSYCI